MARSIQGIQGIDFRGIKLPMEQYHEHFSVNYKINALFDQTRGFFTVKIKSLWPSPAACAMMLQGEKEIQQSLCLTDLANLFLNLKLKNL